MLTTFVTPIFLIPLDGLKINKSLFGIVLILVVISANFSFFRPHDFLGRQDSYYLNRYIPVLRASEEYMTLKEEYLRLTKYTTKRPEQNFPIVSSSSAVLKVDKLNDLDILIKTDSSEAAEISYNKYFFPGWQAKIDSQSEVSLTPGNPYGQIVFSVPKGIHQVKVSFSETNFKLALDIISAGAFLLSLTLIAWRTKLTKD